LALEGGETSMIITPDGDPNWNPDAHTLIAHIDLDTSQHGPHPYRWWVTLGEEEVDSGFTDVSSTDTEEWDRQADQHFASRGYQRQDEEDWEIDLDKVGDVGDVGDVGEGGANRAVT
jgi:hypothetical protein